MILDHFALSRHPFTATTSPDGLYRSQAFQEASKRLAFLLSMQEGIGLLTAEPGVISAALANFPTRKL
jgi:type II secretory pathway predicted ATPase ExeA